MADQAIDRTRELAEEALDRADEWLKPVGLSIKERPMTVLAVVGGLAFAAGAFWMLTELPATVSLRRGARDPFRPAPPRRLAVGTHGGASSSPIRTGASPQHIKSTHSRSIRLASERNRGSRVALAQFKPRSMKSWHNLNTAAGPTFRTRPLT